MTFYNRKTHRLAGYDYATENYYFVTICTYAKQNILIEKEELTKIGQIAQRELINIPTHFVNIVIDKFIVMSNHIHIILGIGCNEKTITTSKLPTLSKIIGDYKSGVSRLVHEIFPNINIWQKSFYDHVIRNEKSYEEIAKYIDNNPMQLAVEMEANSKK